MNLGIEGKRALVVGASRGMGRAVALELARAGCTVAAVARSQDLLIALRNEMGERHHAIVADMMQPGAVAEVLRALEVIRVKPDIVYYAMGGSVDGIREWDRPYRDWEAVTRFNLGVAHDLNRAFVPAMRAQKWGRIVMTSSDATKCNSGNVPYSSAKFALEGYVKVASKLFAPDNVILSAVSPGPIYTEGRFLYSQSPEWTQAFFDKYLPIRRFGRAEEVAKAVAFLCSEHASFMPGAIVDVHGGSR